MLRVEIDYFLLAVPGDSQGHQHVPFIGPGSAFVFEHHAIEKQKAVAVSQGPLMIGIHRAIELMAIRLTVAGETSSPRYGSMIRPTFRVEAPRRKQSKLARSTWGARRT